MEQLQDSKMTEYGVSFCPKAVTSSTGDSVTGCSKHDVVTVNGMKFPTEFQDSHLNCWKVNISNMCTQNKH